MQIPYIDDLTKTTTQVKRHIGGLQVMDCYVIARPEEAYGLLRWKNRFIQAIAIIKGDAIAVRFHK